MDAEISPRHLSFLETGRAAPSREMVLRIAERLEVPMRERNALLVAAGFAPLFPARSLDDPVLRGYRCVDGAMPELNVGVSDAHLVALLKEVNEYPSPQAVGTEEIDPRHAFIVPLRISTDAGVLSFFSITTVFGTPVDVTLSELALELFFPADAFTSENVRRMQVHFGRGDP